MNFTRSTNALVAVISIGTLNGADRFNDTAYPPLQPEPDIVHFAGCLRSIGIHLEVPAVPYKEMRATDASESSTEIRAVVERTRAIQRARGFYNAQLPTRHIRKLCMLDEAGERTLEMAVRRMGLSARAHDRILKLARTIADLGESKTISAKHVAEAVQYRSLDRNYWN
jgi:magnesium chelatase family protein